MYEDEWYSGPKDYRDTPVLTAAANGHKYIISPVYLNVGRVAQSV